MVKAPQPCLHLTSEHSTLFDLKQLNIKYKCVKCLHEGSNLWICLLRRCLQITCSEEVKDHSIKHFKENKLHCIHVNLLSQRAWCYICEREVAVNGLNKSMYVCNSIRPSQTYDSSIDDVQFNARLQGMGTGLVGLQNIANTCYMNSALQALSNVPPMTHYFLNCGDLMDHTIDQNSTRHKTGLAKSYQRLICDIWRKRNGETDYIIPRGILYGIRIVHPMFRGFQQHDTQEFLRCLMDQLHEELKEQVYRTPKQQHQLPIEVNVINNNKEDTSSEESSASTSVDLDFVTCENSASEESSLCNEPCVKTSPQIQAQLTSSGGSATITRSIISDIFDGKLLSSVQCLTCDRVSTREETFQDLSLPIPDRDFVNVLHQANSLSIQSLNFAETYSSLFINKSWLSWLWNLLRTWFWGPFITLHDCMASFFSTDELKGDNMYSCEKCKKLRTGVKFSKVLHLPEVLCIHLKRFRHDLSYSAKISLHVEFPLEMFDMRPYLHKDCKSQISHYNLTAVICHYGTVGGGHYICFARNALLNRWYEFDDHYITEVSVDIVQKCQAYVLFYSKHNPQMDLIRCEANDLASSYHISPNDIRFYVTRDWLARFNTFAEPGPINNWTILCPHGGIVQSKASIMNQLAVPLPQQVWEYLQSKFGGGPAINMLFECATCKCTAETLTRRQFYEHSSFVRLSTQDAAESDSGAIYAISMDWFRKWQQFTRGLTNVEPGPINNSNIVDFESDVTSKYSPVGTVRLDSDYAQVNAPLWQFLHGIYGGGPKILLRPSLTEEIEIVDEDEWENYDGDNVLLGTNVSDTESNIDYYCITPQTKDDVSIRLEKNATHNSNEQFENHRQQHRSFQPLHSKVKKPLGLSKVHISFGKRSDKVKRSINQRGLCNNIRKRVKPKRSDLRNSDLFGAKGTYITKDEIELMTSDDSNSDSSLSEDKRPDVKYLNKCKKMGDAVTKTENVTLKNIKQI